MLHYKLLLGHAFERVLAGNLCAFSNGVLSRDNKTDNVLLFAPDALDELPAAKVGGQLMGAMASQHLCSHGPNVWLFSG